MGNRAAQLALVFAGMITGFVGSAVTACTSLDGLAGGSDEVVGAKGDAGRPLGAGSSDTNDNPSTAPESGAPPPASRCDTTMPFGSPTLMTQLDPTSDFVKDAVLSQDELELFYLRYAGNGSWDLRHARRASRDAVWGTIETVPTTPSPDGTLSLTAGDLKLYFWTIDGDYRTARTTANDTFSTPKSYDVPSAPAPFVVAADDTAYFAQYTADATTDKMIRRADVTSYGFSSPSSPVANIHVAGAQDSHPVLNASETVMYFASNRPGSALDDIWVARRGTKQAEFGAPFHVAELSTDEPDAVTWVAEDECQVLLNRASHVYLAVRPQ